MADKFGAGRGSDTEGLGARNTQPSSGAGGGSRPPSRVAPDGPTCLMVCDNCGHIDSGPVGAIYECPSCGWGSGWGAENQAGAERLATQIIERGRVDLCTCTVACIPQGLTEDQTCRRVVQW
jgi:hypothetical protein